MTNKKVCYILSYSAPDYIRTRTLLRALENIAWIDLYKAINTRKNSLRYFETILKLIKIRVSINPDLYILGFRGNEIFFLVKLITLGKPLIFDSFVSPSASLTGEKKLGKLGYVIGRLVTPFEWLMLKWSDIILTDTNENAAFQSRYFRISLENFKTIYVGTDEKEFKPSKLVPKNKAFEVFIYATFLPLHGIDIVLDAARLLKSQSIHFTIAGGKGKNKKLAEFTQRITEENITNVTHYSWIEFDTLKEYINKADLCLGGPFGNTKQSNIVITGKTFQFIASAKPTVIGFNKEVLKCGFLDKKNCLVVKQGNAQELADSILWAHKNRIQLKEIATNGRNLYEKRFSDQQITRSIEEIIKSINHS